MLHSFDLKTMLNMFILNIDFLHSDTNYQYSFYKPGCFNIPFKINLKVCTHFTLFVDLKPTLDVYGGKIIKSLFKMLQKGNQQTLIKN